MLKGRRLGGLLGKKATSTKSMVNAHEDQPAETPNGFTDDTHLSGKLSIHIGKKTSRKKGKAGANEHERDRLEEATSPKSTKSGVDTSEFVMVRANSSGTLWYDELKALGRSDSHHKLVAQSSSGSTHDQQPAPSVSPLDETETRATQETSMSSPKMAQKASSHRKLARQENATNRMSQSVPPTSQLNGNTAKRTTDVADVVNGTTLLEKAPSCGAHFGPDYHMTASASLHGLHTFSQTKKDANGKNRPRAQSCMLPLHRTTSHEQQQQQQQQQQQLNRRPPQPVILFYPCEDNKARDSSFDEGNHKAAPNPGIPRGQPLPFLEQLRLTAAERTRAVHSFSQHSLPHRQPLQQPLPFLEQLRLRAAERARNIRDYSSRPLPYLEQLQHYAAQRARGNSPHHLSFPHGASPDIDVGGSLFFSCYQETPPSLPSNLHFKDSNDIEPSSSDHPVRTAHFIERRDASSASPSSGSVSSVDQISDAPNKHSRSGSLGRIDIHSSDTNGGSCDINHGGSIGAKLDAGHHGTPSQRRRSFSFHKRRSSADLTHSNDLNLTPSASSEQIPLDGASNGHPIPVPTVQKLSRQGSLEASGDQSFSPKLSRFSKTRSSVRGMFSRSSGRNSRYVSLPSDSSGFTPRISLDGEDIHDDSEMFFTDSPPCSPGVAAPSTEECLKRNLSPGKLTKVRASSLRLSASSSRSVRRNSHDLAVWNSEKQLDSLRNIKPDSPKQPSGARKLLAGVRKLKTSTDSAREDGFQKFQRMLRGILLPMTGKHPLKYLVGKEAHWVDVVPCWGSWPINGELCYPVVTDHLGHHHNRCSAEMVEICRRQPMCGIFSDCSKSEWKFRNAVWELLRSECVYLMEVLLVFDQVHLEVLMRLKKGGFLIDADKEKITGNWSELRKQSESLCYELLSLFTSHGPGKRAPIANIIKAFDQFPSRLHQPYYEYGQHYHENVPYIDSLLEQREFHAYDEFCQQHPRVRKRGLKSFLFEPVQRLQRLPMLLKDIVRLAPADCSSPDIMELTSAVTAIQVSCQQLDGQVRRHQKHQVCVELQKTIRWPTLHELDPRCALPQLADRQLTLESLPLDCEWRWLAHHGQLKLHENSLGSSGKVNVIDITAFLFNDLLLLTKFIPIKGGRNSKDPPPTPGYSVPGSPVSSLPRHLPLPETHEYLVCRQPYPTDRLDSIDLPPSGSGKFLFCILVMNCFRQYVTGLTLEALSEKDKVEWLQNLEKARHIWSPHSNW